LLFYKFLIKKILSLFFKNNTLSQYTPFEEKLNFGSHFFGLLLYIFCCPYLIFTAIQNPSKVNIAGLVIFSVGLIAVYATSSMYHFIENKELKTKFRTLDHMAIFLLIGGTYTPLVNKYISEPLGTIFLTILWTILIGGIVMKYFFMGRFRLFSVFLYVFLGSMVLFIIKPIIKDMPHNIFIYVLLGGVTYLIGVPFYMRKNLKYTHFLWHIFVLVASFFHYIAIYKTVTIPL
jgi:hemolysin III